MYAIDRIETAAQTDTDGRCDPIRGTPWEKLGHPIPKNSSVQQMLDAAELNWKVLRGNTVIHVNDENGEPHVVPNPKAFALVRSTDFEVLSPFVGPRYKPIQNEDAFRVFREFVQAGQMTMETAGSISNGRHIWGLARTGHSFELADGERIESYFLLLQSHYYGYALKAMWTPIRFPGGHTLMQNINTKGIGSGQTYTMSHASKFNDARIHEIKQVVGIAARSMAEFQGKAEFMERMRVDSVDAIRYLIRVFDEGLPGRCKTANERLPETFTEVTNASLANRNLKKVCKMLDEAYKNGRRTAWSCWNTVNQAYDHELGHGDNTRLETNWLGKNRDAKLKAFSLANALAASKGK
jgi:phage/plasmid-like protein (TIGR03299 family)